MVSESITLFVPLLLAVVTALSSFLRDSVNLITAVNEERPSFPLFSMVFPPLGRFTVIHISNISLLLIGILIVKELSTDKVVALIGSLILGVFLLILPIIEIDEYDAVLSEADFSRLSPKSYYYHCVSMIFLSLSFFGFVELQVLILNFLLSRGFSIGGTALWAINRALELMLFPSFGLGLMFLYLSMVALSNEIGGITEGSTV